LVRRISFGIALGLVLLATTNVSIAWILDSESARWLPTVLLLACVGFVVGVMVSLRDVLKGLWRLRRAQTDQAQRLSAVEAVAANAVRELELQHVEARAATGAIESGLGAIERFQRENLHSTLVALMSGQDALVSGQDALVSGQDALVSGQDALVSGQDALVSGQDALVSGQDAFVRPALERMELQYLVDMRSAIKRIEREQDAAYRQLESHVSLTAALRLPSPLPPMRRTWALAPDSAALLIRLISEREPELVVELGSGISTVLIASVLARIGSGRLITIEHDEAFADVTSRLLRGQGLEDECEVIVAPLKDIELDDTTWRWYDPTAFANVEGVNLVLVDGPPGRTGPMARYPALPVLGVRLVQGALIFLDDTRRADEESIISRWLAEFPVVSLDIPKTEAGASLLEWGSS
jgi:predicted O-methyltransferase YrrM